MRKILICLSRYVLVLIAMLMFAGCNQATGQIDENSVANKPQDNPSGSKKGQKNLSEMFSGTIVEIINTGRHAYVQVDTGEKKVWVSVQDFSGKINDKVLVPPGEPRANFHSKQLNRDFDMIYFVANLRPYEESKADSVRQALPKDHPPIDMSSPNQMTHPPMDMPQGAEIEVKGIDKAVDGYTVSEIIIGRKDLAGKEVRVRAKVVKFTPEIMDRNWLHVRDGSGDENTNDLIVTTKAVVKVGDVVMIKGIVAVDQDLGFGLKYRVLIEEAEVTVE